MSKQDELKQAEANRDYYAECTKSGLVGFDFEIERIKKQIAAAEVTYSRGDRFNVEDGTKAMLVNLGNQKMAYMSLELGSLWGGDPIKVGHVNRITQMELSKICTSWTFTRYWDNRKQEKC